MAFDRIPYQSLDVGTESDLITWDNLGEPDVFTLGLGDFLYKDATGALASVGAGATVDQVIVSDGAGGWTLADQTGSGGPGSFTVDRQVYTDPADYTGGVTVDLQLPVLPPGANPLEQENAVLVLFDGVAQGINAFDITDNITPTVFDTITFTSPIPIGLTNGVEVLVFRRPTASSIVFDPTLVVGPPDIIPPAILPDVVSVQEAIDLLDTYLVNLDATQVSFDDTLLASGTATNVQEAIDAIATDPGLIPTPFASSLVIIEDQRAVGVNGGDAVDGSWFPRTLNTFQDSVIPFGAALGANQITLPDGEYLIEFNSVFNTDSEGPLGNIRTRIWNTTDSTTELLSMSNVVDGCATIQGNANSCGFGRVTVAGGPKVFELQYQVEYDRLVRGLGAASGFDTEIYALIKIWQL